MQQVKIVIVCRFNQARSIVAAAMLRNFFPELQIATCGIEGEDGKPIPVISADLSESWGLKEYDRVSRSLSFLETCSSNDFVLAADDWVFENIQRHFPHLRVANLVGYAKDARLVPIDPTGMNPTSFSEEIAKACVLSLRWVEDVLDYPTSDVEAHVFQSKQNLSEFVKNPTLHAPGIKIFIDTDVAYPDAAIWKHSNLEVVNFHPRLLKVDEKKDLSPSRPRILLSRFELDFPAQLFLTPQWRTFLLEIAAEGPVALICRSFPQGPRSLTGTILTMNAGTTIVHD